MTNSSHGGEGALAIDSARRRFFGGDEVGPTLLRDEILRSWQRSRDAGVDMLRPISFDPIPKTLPGQIKERCSRLLHAAAPELDSLARAVGKLGHVVLLVDETGTTIAASGNLESASPLLRYAARIGFNLDERNVGTTAPGAVLIEGSPLTVLGREHFVEAYQYNCAAAPIFGPSGNMLGVIDITGEYAQTTPPLLSLAILSARAIENRLFSALHDEITLHFHPRRELLGTVWEAIMAFREDGICIAANPAALSWLGKSREQVIAHSIEEVCNLRLQAIGRNLSSGVACTPQPIMLGNGMEVFACFSPPLEPSSFLSASRPGVKDAKDISFDARQHIQTSAQDRSVASATDKAKRAFGKRVPVLIDGETGCGKEVLARLLHESSARSHGPFVPINCASLPEGLIESELFGYADGAFTGSKKGGAIGKIAQANGGTLFLDEIGDMPLALQARLLRVLQDGMVLRLGSSTQTPVDFLLVCATHQDLLGMVAHKLFREDLYYRINGLRVTLPPLRDRSDILALADEIIAETAARTTPPALSQEVQEFLLRHPWPGNIRQMRSVLRVALAMMEGEETIEVRHLPQEFTGEKPQKTGELPKQAQPRSLNQIETDAIVEAIEANHGNLAAVARSLRISRSTLYRKISQYLPS